MSELNERRGRRDLIRQGVVTAAGAVVAGGALAALPGSAAAQPGGASIVAVVTGIVFGGVPDEPDKPAVSVTYSGGSGGALGEVEVIVNPADAPQAVQQQIVGAVKAQWNELFQAEFGPAGRVLVFGAPFQG